MSAGAANRLLRIDGSNRRWRVLALAVAVLYLGAVSPVLGLLSDSVNHGTAPSCECGECGCAKRTQTQPEGAQCCGGHSHAEETLSPGAGATGLPKLIDPCCSHPNQPEHVLVTTTDLHLLGAAIRLPAWSPGSSTQFWTRAQRPAGCPRAIDKIPI